jgi:hypothetical protein
MHNVEYTVHCNLLMFGLHEERSHPRHLSTHESMSNPHRLSQKVVIYDDKLYGTPMGHVFPHDHTPLNIKEMARFPWSQVIRTDSPSNTPRFNHGQEDIARSIPETWLSDRASTVREIYHGPGSRRPSRTAADMTGRPSSLPRDASRAPALSSPISTRTSFARSSTSFSMSDENAACTPRVPLRNKPAKPPSPARI